MKKAIWYCDSQMNILSAYFLKRIMHSDADRQVLLVSNNSDNTLECAYRIKRSSIWDEVVVIEEKMRPSIELYNILDDLDLEAVNQVCLFALQNRFSRVLYDKFQMTEASINIIDEGILLFRDFMNKKKINTGDFLYNINIENRLINGWCYEPKLYELPSNVHLKKIDLIKYFHENTREIKKMQEEVQYIFNVKKDINDSIIYFDQYLTQSGRTCGMVEKYLLNKTFDILNDFDFVIKPHPMENGFYNKYEKKSSKVMKHEKSPWEAIYFVNYFGKENQKITCIAVDSSSLVNPLIMYGNKNYQLILLCDIYKNVIGASTWGARDYFIRIKTCLGIDNISLPKNYKELNNLLNEQRNTSSEEKSFNYDLSYLDEEMLTKLAQIATNLLPKTIISTLEIELQNGERISLTKEQVYCDEQFEIEFSIQNHLEDREIKKVTFYPCGRFFVGFKNVEILANETDELQMISNQETEVYADGYEMNKSLYPSYTILTAKNSPVTIKIKGEWTFDIDRNRVFDYFENEHDVETEKICSQEKMIQNQERLLNEKEEVVQRMGNRLLQLENEIFQYQESTSWRITKPLRMIAEKIRR